jgi:hypothetical protein
LDARRHARGGRRSGSRDPGQRRLARYHVIPTVRERPRDSDATHRDHADRC